MRMKRVARLALGAAACSVLLGAAAPSCLLDQSIGTIQGKPTIQFEGDSITVGAKQDLNAHYGADYAVGIHAIIGVTSTRELPAVATQGEQAPDIEVINLGTNDAACGPNPCGELPALPFDLAAYEANLRTFLADFPPSACVVFVTINAHNPGWGIENAVRMNNYIRSTFAHVADWDAIWSRDYFDTFDNPHPNEIGRTALIGEIDRAIATCPAP